ncbi:kielin/chordin-like protein [Vespula pensylvanica]|uniref:Kielin/chordin-like protein n=1 Tax=Vespula pensylvanica TaxID=30213 RepID=A0A834K4J7_VESPE|nr:kielin/chordin-like protein [Vespula pensylvanica]KAF7398279.1 hypothetical protein H0235_016287 [Vespula pensylvanica]
MTKPSDNRSLLFEKFALLFLLTIVSINAKKECDLNNCPGPLKYYENLGCKPVYQKEGDCCAIRYDCDHLKLRSKNKCYVNGHEYSIGEHLKEEDSNPCDIGCICRQGLDDIASFVCAVVDCFHGPQNPNCYFKHSPDNCCPGPEVCVNDLKDRATCMVDGKLYYDGDYFTVESDPDLNCNCQPGYKGENVEPFCKKPNHPYCSPDFRNAYDIYNNCAPVYYDNQSPQTGCNLSTRCQNANDTVIHNHEEAKHAGEDEDDTMLCKFGNLKMHLGDELNQPANEFTCMKCLCEVPPIPTCQYLPPTEKCN